MSNVSDSSYPSVEIHHRHGQGPVVILCEHASHHIPDRYRGLGLAPADRRSHAAWDPGARGVAMSLSERLEAPLVASRISRLVYDCNRPPEAESAMPTRVEVIEVPGNRGLDAAQRAARVEGVYRPFCDAVTEVLAERRTRAVPSVLITIHSFTPQFHGRRREVEIGILHDADRRLADAMLAHASNLGHRCIRRNAPYGPEDGVTHSLKLHGIGQGLANVMIEVRNDLLATPEDQQVIAEELCRLIHPALASLGVATSPGEGGDNA